MAILQCELQTKGSGFSRLVHDSLKSPAGIGPTLHLPVYVDPKAKPVLTPFRLYSIRLIQRAADYSVGLPICYARVFIEPNPPGEDGWFLVLNLTCATKDEDLPRIRQAILSAVRDAAADWTAEERADYSEHIYFELDAIPG